MKSEEITRVGIIFSILESRLSHSFVLEDAFSSNGQRGIGNMYSLPKTFKKINQRMVQPLSSKNSQLVNIHKKYAN